MHLHTGHSCLGRLALHIACVFLVCACSTAETATSAPPEMLEARTDAPREAAETPVQVDGIHGDAWRFDGQDDFLRLVLDEQAEPLDAISVAVWIKLKDLAGSATHTILSWKEDDGTAGRLFIVRPEYKGLPYRLGLTVGEISVVTREAGMTSGLWYHLGVVAGDGTISFYLDGVPFHEEKSNGLPTVAPVAGRVGLGLIGEDPFAGVIDVIQVVPEALNAKEVSRLYRDELGNDRLQTNREQLLDDFPSAEKHLEDPDSEWTTVSQAPYWYGKAWNWNEVWEWPEHEGEAITVIAAPDSPNQEGADILCDGVDDDIEIQRALDAVPESGGKVVLRKGTYRLGNVIRPKSRTELEIHGMLKVDDAMTSKLTKDATMGDNIYHVADAEEFRPGQWVTIVDDNKVDHKGGWEDWRGGRKYGECAQIASIEENAIQLEGTFNQYENWGNWSERPEYRKDYLVEANAFVTTSHSAILVQGQRFVYIHGTGSVFGNRMNQSRTAPLSTWQRWEEMRADSGIVVCDSSFVRIEGLRVYDANLHNVVFWMCENCEGRDLEAFGSNDKNIVSVKTNRLRLMDNYSHDSVREDGIIFYMAGYYALVGKNRIIDNPRLGLHMHESCRYMTSIQNVLMGNRTNTTLSEGDERRSLSIEDVIGR